MFLCIVPAGSTLQTIEQHQGGNQVLIAYGGTNNIQSFQLG